MNRSAITASTTPQVLNISCSAINHNETVLGTGTQFIGDGISVATNTTVVQDLPPFSIDDPKPVSGGCTSDSMTRPSWTVSGLGLALDSITGPTMANLKFNLKIDSAGYNSFIQRPFNVTSFNVTSSNVTSSNVTSSNVTSSNVTDSSWVDCAEPESRIPSCRFKFDLAASRLTIEEQWICSDKSNHRQ